jgi:SAM-dependent methyltransferase
MKNMVSSLVRIHHAEYIDDIPFWIQQTEGLDPVLEIGCGFGRVTLPLAEAGRTLVGVDQDQHSLAYLQGALAGLDDDICHRVSLINADIFTFQPKSQFGGVIIPCNTYTTFHPKDRIRLLQQIHSYLRSAGALIISLPNPHQMDRIFTNLGGKNEIESPDLEVVFTHPDTGYPVQVSSQVRTTHSSLLWDWIYDHLQPDGQVDRSVVTVEHFPASSEEFLSELSRESFREIHLQGDFYGESFQEDSPYLILQCRK